MISRECNNTLSKQNICRSLSIPSFIFIYYCYLCVEGNPNERNEKTSYVYIYICVWCVCVSICVYYIYEYVVIGSVWHSWQVCLSCCCILGVVQLVCTVAGTVSEVSSVTVLT